MSLPNILHNTRYAKYIDNFSALKYGCRTLKLVLEKIVYFEFIVKDVYACKVL